MKILIPLTILVLSFIIYYFFNTPMLPEKKDAHVAVSIEPVPITKEKTVTEHNYISNLATVETIPVTNKKPAAPKEYLTLDDLRHNRQQVTTNSQITTESQSYDQMVFEQLKRILQQASSTYYAKKHIVLNSYISSILPSQNARERFKTLLGSDFGLDEETINQEMKHNRTVWDWVLFLSP